MNPGPQLVPSPDPDRAVRLVGRSSPAARRPTGRHPTRCRLVPALLLAASALAQAQPATTFAEVGPLLAQRCAKCHTDGGLMGAAPEGLRLTSYALALDASDRARIVPGQPEASELLRRIRGQALPRMPMDGPPYLSADEIALVQRWIEQGARSADGTPAALPVGAKVRLHGTLRAGPLLDDLPLQIGAGARLDKAPAAGQRAQVRGHIGAQGQVVVERLRGR